MFMKGIYVIKNNDDEPVYVGKAVNIYNRWGDHLSNYPYAEYKYEVLEIVGGRLNEREQYWIDEMNTLLNGDNKVRAVRVVETRQRPNPENLPPILKTGYPRKRVLDLLKTFDGDSCSVCGDPTTRYLTWYPYHNKITSLLYRYGTRTPERKEALDLIDECRPVCHHCIIDKEWGEEKAPF